MEHRSDAEAKQKVWDMIKDIRVALLGTRDSEGHLHSRPMVAVETEFNGELWFFTRSDCRKVSEIETDPRVLLSYSNPDDQNYVSISGTGSIVRDRAKIKELWSEYLRTWFPKGSDDPDIALLKVTVDLAEYWDAPSSALLHAYGYVKARLTGESPKAGDVAQVDFQVGGIPKRSAS